jgi:hypothetical protein
MSELSTEHGESFLARLNAGKRELGRLLAQKIPSSTTSPLQLTYRIQSSSTRSQAGESGDIEHDVKRTRCSLYSANITEADRSGFACFLRRKAGCVTRTAQNVGRYEGGE